MRRELYNEISDKGDDRAEAESVSLTVLRRLRPDVGAAILAGI